MRKDMWRDRLRGRAPATPGESVAVTRSVVTWLRRREPSSVLLYLPMVGEVDVRGAVDRRHRWYVTRTPAGGLPLTVHDHDTARERHPFGYDQPVADAPAVDPATIDVVLAPGLAFDRDGGRLGWGKGYYDRLFATTPRAVAVGVTIDRWLVDEPLPVEVHDRRMDWLATESGVWEPGREQG